MPSDFFPSKYHKNRTAQASAPTNRRGQQSSRKDCDGAQYIVPGRTAVAVGHHQRHQADINNCTQRVKKL